MIQTNGYENRFTGVDEIIIHDKFSKYFEKLDYDIVSKSIEFIFIVPFELFFKIKSTLKSKFRPLT